VKNADTCFTATDNFAVCTGQNILVGQIPAPLAGVSDQQYPATNGQNMYYTNGLQLSLVQVANGTTNVTASYATNFQFATGLAVDTFNPMAERIFVGDDPSEGNLPGSGRWWEVLAQAPPLAIPGAPINVSATVGNA